MERLLKNKYAFLFQGAGTVFRKYFESLDLQHMMIIRKNCSIVKHTTGIDLWEYICNNIIKTDEELLDQLTVYTINCSIFEMYLQYNIYPYMLLGYSLGIYSALVSGGAITFKDGIMLIIKGYEYMKECMDGKECAMASIIGLKRADIEEILTIAECGNTVEIASENNLHSLVISGLKEGVDKVNQIAIQEGALKIVQIKVSFPFHTKLVEKAADRFLNFLDSIVICRLKYPLVTCTNQDLIRYPKDIKEELYLNLKTNISWLKSIEKIGILGVDAFIEVGLGESLTKISRLINRDLKFYGFNTLVEKSDEFSENIKLS